MKNFLLGTIAAVALGATGGWAAPPTRPAFSADVTIHSKGDTITEKMYLDGDKIRTDVNAKGHDVTSIIRSDRHLMYMVLNEQHMYMEMPLNYDQARVPVAPTSRSDAQIVLIGPDVVNGQACDKYSVTVNGVLQGHEWRAKGQVLPVRYASADGQTTMDYTNVKMGAPDASVFEPPAGYQKMNMPGGPPHTRQFERATDKECSGVLWNVFGMHAPGEVIAGRFRVDAILGSGGMGSVYQATQLSVDRTLALKEMVVDIPDGEARTAAIRQFHTEAQLLYSLEHPALPRLYDFFDDDGKYYLAMELVRGCTLEAYYAVNAVAEDQALDWAQQISNVLQYLHTHDPPIIFRDLKPSNVMIGTDKKVKLIDFGIAKIWDQEEGQDTQTRTVIRGACSPGYAAPEQYGGGTDARTDLYALGATLYTALTRTITPQSVDLASGRARLPSLKELRPDLSDSTIDLIEWLMKLKLSERPQSAAEVIKVLSDRRAAPPQRPYQVAQPPSQQTKLRVSQPSINTQRSLVAPSAPSGKILWGGGLALLIVAGAWTATHLLATTPKPPVAVISPLPIAVATTTPIPVESPIALVPSPSSTSVDFSPSAAPSASPAELPSAVVSATPEMRPTTQAVQCIVSAVPANTQLYAGDRLLATVGPAPQYLLFEPGPWNLIFKHAGYQDQPITFSVDSDSAGKPLKVVLVARDGSIKVTGPKGAHVKIDDHEAGVAPFISKPLHASKHVVQAALDGFQPATRTVDLKPGENAVVAMAMVPVSHVDASTPSHSYHTYYPHHNSPHVHTYTPSAPTHHRPSTIRIPHYDLPNRPNVIRIPHQQ